MKFYRLISDVKWRVSNDCAASAERSPRLERVMPPIACPVCGGSTRDTRNPGFCYPAVNVQRFPSPLRKKLNYATVIGPEAWEELRRKVMSCLPYEVPITPGTLFGPGTLEVHGRFADIYPDVSSGSGRFMLSRTAWQRLQAAGIQDLFAVPIAVQSRRKAPDHYLELQIEHHARLQGSLDRSAIEADLRKIKADWARRRVLVCQRCGREDGEIPKQIVLVGSTIPEGVSLFRLTQRPRTLLCAEAFAEAARRLAFTNILFEPVRTDGSETTKGLARVHVCHPELWSSSESKPSRKRRAAGSKPTAEAARVKKAPPFPAIDSVLRSPALRGQAEALRALARPCLRLAFHPAPKVPLGASRFGGLPDLPKEVTWPGARGIQLDFVAQLNCGDLSRALPAVGLPASGWLWFFYDVEHSPAGLMSKDKDQWAVRYWDGPVKALSPASPPAWWVGNTAFPRCQLAVQPGNWLPDAKDPVVRALKLKPAEAQAYGGALKKLRGPESTPLHKLLGWPDTIQNAMEADCQQLAGRGDWQLLLQLDSDATANLMWGDSGRLYLWIRREDLQAQRFDRCWVLVQCY